MAQDLAQDQSCIVHGRDKPLTKSQEIALRNSFDRPVTEQELDLLQFSSSSVAQAEHTCGGGREGLTLSIPAT